MTDSNGKQINSGDTIGFYIGTNRVSSWKVYQEGGELYIGEDLLSSTLEDGECKCLIISYKLVSKGIAVIH